MSLAGNRCHNVSELLEVYQAIDLVFCCETARGLLFVLVNPTGKVVGYADIKSSRQACHDVDVVGFQDPKDRGSSAALRLPLNDRIRPQTKNSQTLRMTTKIASGWSFGCGGSLRVGPSQRRNRSA